MSKEEFNEEDLDGILEELEGVDDESIDMSKEIDSATEKSEDIQKKLKDSELSEYSQELPDVENLKLEDNRVINKNIPPVPVPGPQPDAAEAMIDLQKIFADYEKMSDEVCKDCRSDRAEIQDYINILMASLKIQQGQGTGKIDRGILDNLVKALEVKTRVNELAIRTRDTAAKLVSAAKGTINIMNQNNNISSGDGLEQILEDPVDEY